ncbi:hypothetical protein NRBB57_1171 [Bifidobacterium breve]|nr:hypothetical protein NRBB57_1171 [Bifidobacterium breve]
MHTGVRGARPGLFPDRGRRAMGGRACGGRRRRGSAVPVPPILSGPQPVPEIVFSQHWFFGPFFTNTGENPEGMHRYACGMHHLMHTFDPMKTLGIQGI